MQVRITPREDLLMLKAFNLKTVIQDDTQVPLVDAHALLITTLVPFVFGEQVLNLWCAKYQK